MASSNIHGKAKECIEEFKLLFKIEVQVRESGKAEHLTPDELRMDDQLARFRMWAGNIGAFADGHASLDYRLRDNENAKKMMIRFLENLRESLRWASEALPDSRYLLATNSLLQNPTQEGLTDTTQASTSSQISSSFQGTDTESIQNLLLDTKLQNPFEQHLQEAERTIDRLYRLSVLIRQPSISSQNSKAEKFVITDEEGNDINESFASFSFQLLTHRFPDAPEHLRQRLARGITVRRRRFQYRQSHQKKLSATKIVVSSENKRDTTEVDSTIKGVEVFQESRKQSYEDHPQRLSTTRLPSLTSASAMTRRPIAIEKITDDDISKQSTVFTMAFTQDTPVSIPAPPKPAPGSKEFECPYCCMFLPIKQAKASHWRKHVLNDLEPYVCVFENCSEHHTLFRDQRAWVSHMQRAHTSRWLCTLAGHRPCTFNNEMAYEEHMRTTHDDMFTEAQLSVLKKRSKIPALALFDECPLCGFKPSANDLKKAIHNRRLGETRDEVAKVASDLITKHVGGHLEFVSVKALPWQDISEEAKSETTLSKRAEEGSGVRDSDDSIKTEETTSASSLDDLPSGKVTWSDTDEGLATASSNISFEKDYEQDWGFIPLPPYHGHDRDPTLQTLLRKLYLDSTPAAHGFGPRLPAYSVPVDRDKNFVGRKLALHTVREALCPNDVTISVDSKPLTFPRCFTIFGPGGLGKTQVAAQFVVVYRQAFDAILWVHAETPSKIAQDFQAIAIILGLVAENSADATDQTFTRNVVKRWLVNPQKRLDESDSSSPQKASWLLVFDGVEEPDDLNEFWPYNGPGSILITSRSPYSWSASLLLQPLSADEATTYLLQVTGRNAGEKEELAVKAVANRLGGLPLALAQMGSIILHKGMSFAQFLNTYDEKESQQQLLHWQLSDARRQNSNYKHNIASVWAFDSLAQSGTLLLNILSMLDADGVPERIFLPDASDETLPESLSQEAYKKARNELSARSLVTSSKREKKLFIHRLVQDIARARMRPSELRTTFHLCVKLLSANWPFEPFTWRHGITRWAVCEELYAHVQRLENLFPEITRSADSLNDYGFAKLVVDVSWYRFERGKFADVIQLSNLAQSICESLKLRVLEDPESFSDGDVTLAQLNYTLHEINHNRGLVALETNETEDALRYLKLFNRIMVKEFKDKSPDIDMRLALSWNELGNAYMLDQDWAKGEQAFKNSIKEMKRLTNFNPTSISLPMANLGLAYWVQNKHDRAVSVLLEGLEDRRVAFGVDDQTSFITGRLLYALGNVKDSLQLFDESHDYHRRALLVYKSTLGNRHHRTADTFVKVAEHNIRLRQYEMALASLDRAIEAYSWSSSYIPEKVRASFKRIKALHSLHKEAEAESELESCFKVYTMIFNDRVQDKKVQESSRKSRKEDLQDRDFDEIMSFWSR